MKKTFALITRSYKYGGYCIAGIDTETKRWIRLVSSASPANNEIPKSVFEPFQDLDILEVETKGEVPHGCQRENYLLDLSIPPKKVGKLSFRELLSSAYVSTSPTIFGNLSSGLSEEEIMRQRTSLGLFMAESLLFDYYLGDDGKRHYRSTFTCRGRQYSGISVTDPFYRKDDFAGQTIGYALLVISLPALPYPNGKYYKFIAKIFPVSAKEAERIISAPTLISEEEKQETAAAPQTDFAEEMARFAAAPSTILEEEKQETAAAPQTDFAEEMARFTAAPQTDLTPRPRTFAHDDPFISRENTARAVHFLQALADGRDPDTDAVLDPALILTPSYATWLHYCAKVMARVPQESEVRRPERTSVCILRRNIEKIVLSDDPVTASTLSERVSAVCEPYGKKLTALAISKFFLEMGMLREEGAEHKRKLPTELGRQYGIGTEQRITTQGVRYLIVLYGRRAQQFLVDNIARCVDVIGDPRG